MRSCYSVIICRFWNSCSRLLQRFCAGGVAACFHLAAESLITPDVCISADEPITQLLLQTKNQLLEGGGRRSGRRLQVVVATTGHVSWNSGKWPRDYSSLLGSAGIRSLRNDGRKCCPVDQIEYWDKCCRWRDGTKMELSMRRFTSENRELVIKPSISR